MDGMMPQFRLNLGIIFAANTGKFAVNMVTFVLILMLWLLIISPVKIQKKNQHGLLWLNPTSPSRLHFVANMINLQCTVSTDLHTQQS